MTREYYVHTYENGNEVHHEFGGVLYATRRVRKECTKYINLLNPASPKEMIDQLRQDLLEGVTKGVWSRKAGHALVRYGEQKNWHYFPVPLLFESDSKIREESKKRGIQPLPDGWYRRKRNLILKIIGFPEIP